MNEPSFVPGLNATPPPLAPPRPKGFWNIGAAHAEVRRLEKLLHLSGTPLDYSVPKTNRLIQQLTERLSKAPPVAAPVAPAAAKPAPPDLMELTDRIFGPVERQAILAEIPLVLGKRPADQVRQAIVNHFSIKGLTVPGLSSDIEFGHYEPKGARRVVRDRAQQETNSFMAGRRFE